MKTLDEYSKAKAIRAFDDFAFELSKLGICFPEVIYNCDDVIIRGINNKDNLPREIIIPCTKEEYNV